MANHDYEYRGLMAQAWDMLRGDTSTWPDRAFYLNLIRETGEPVLDVGCGTGRLLLDYLSEGIDIDGVDNSPEMLALCIEKANRLGLSPSIHQQRMHELELRRRYQTILVPSSSIQLVIEPSDVEAAMSRFYDHLEPGGTLAMSFMLMGLRPDQTPEQAWEWGELREAEREDGTLIRRMGRARYDLDEQIQHVEYRYQVVKDGQVIAEELHNQSPSARWYGKRQTRALYESAGFDDVQLFGGATRNEATREDLRWIAVGRRGLH